MRLVTGSKLGPYVIEAALGAGGMGEVYRALDTRLGRTVALKILVHVTNEFQQRFEREARAIASLNHPCICMLFDTGREDDTDYLVMEYLEGQTLAQRLLKGALPLDQALTIAIRIAGALDAAHQAGLVHRDLKPGNVMLTRAGAKLLDFGLSLQLASAVTVGDKTKTMPVTSAGMAPGTLPYMSPEQLEGAPADPRSDIFAFGAMLYEMVTGRPAFPGKSNASVIAAIMRSELPPLDLEGRGPAAAQPELARLLRSCTEKDPADRWHCARDLQRELKWIAQPRSEAAAEMPDRARFLIWASVAALLCLIAAVGWTRALRTNRPEAAELRLSILPPENALFDDLSKDSGGSAISPDGRSIVFPARRAGQSQLWVRALDSLDAKPLPGTEQGTFPFWSPDSRSVGFFAGNKLEKIAIATAGSAASPETLSNDAASRGGSWNEDGVVLFTPVSGNVVERISQSGGQPVAVTALDAAQQEITHLWPRFLPDGRHFLYFVRHAQPRNDGIFVSTIEPGTHVPVRVTDAVSGGWYVPENGVWKGSQHGSLLFVRGQTLFAQHFNPATLQLEDDASPVAEGVQTVQAGAVADFSVSRDGAVAYRSGVAMTSRMTWLDSDGRKTGTAGPEGIWAEPRLSWDQQALAATRADPQTGNVDTWLMPLARDVPSRFTFWPDLDAYAIWSPDGSQIVYCSNRPPLNLFIRNSGGAGEERRLSTSPNVQRPRDFSRDGRFVLYEEVSPTSLDDLWILPVNPPGDPFVFLQSPARERQGQFSPAGPQVIAYTSDESGRNEVYIRGFDPAGRASTGRWQISTAGGAQPRWRRDGRELYYLEGDRMMAVSIQPSGQGIAPGTPRQLFESNSFSISELGDDYDVSADGRRFLTLAPTLDNTRNPITVILNWMLRNRGESKYDSAQ